MNHVNWGIIGCGGIAHTFATSVKATEQGKLLACASRSAERSGDFAAEHDVPISFMDYETLVADPGVNAVYIATTHNFHFENIKLCLENGKHVLCEKPFTVSATQTKQLIALAEQKKVFMMEAVWTRFMPAIRKLQELLAEGVIGDVTTVRANFSIDGDFGPEHRLRNPKLAGGALLDLGIYPITMASIVFGRQPEHIQSAAVLGETGVDERSFYLFDYGNGQTAQLSSSFSDRCPTEAIISGTKGYIRIPWFLGAKQLFIHRSGEDEVETLDFPYEDGENFKFEIEHAMECINEGRLESDIHPLSETLAVMETMDTLRAQWDLSYEAE